MAPASSRDSTLVDIATVPPCSQYPFWVPLGHPNPGCRPTLPGRPPGPPDSSGTGTSAPTVVPCPDPWPTSGRSTSRRCSPGPNCARYLADYGADVVKVERPDGGDTYPHVGRPTPATAQTMFYKLANRNKRAITLDLKGDEGRETLLRLADRSHVLIENFRPGKLEALGSGPTCCWPATRRSSSPG